MGQQLAEDWTISQPVPAISYLGLARKGETDAVKGGGGGEGKGGGGYWTVSVLDTNIGCNRLSHCPGPTDCNGPLDLGRWIGTQKDLPPLGTFNTVRCLVSANGQR